MCDCGYSLYYCGRVAELLADGAMAFVSHQPVISDGQTMGSEGMRYSLISRDVIADCIEVMHSVSACASECIQSTRMRLNRP